MPVIGVAKAGWNLDQFKARALDSLEKHGGADPEAFRKLSSLLRYVDGDYGDPATFEALGRELQGSRRPAHYLAIPPAMFEPVLENLDTLPLHGERADDRREALRSRPRVGAASQ